MLLSQQLGNRIAFLRNADIAQNSLNERLILIALALANTLAPLNSTMIAVALPNIMRDLSVGMTDAGWLLTIYLIVTAALQPLTGKLGDRFGRRTMILGGLCYFGLVSLGAAMSNNLPLLIFFRVQQGIAGAITFPNSSALLRSTIPAERRGGRFGVIGASGAIAAASGPPLAGLLISWFGWRAIFYINLPIVIVSLILGWLALPTSTRRAIQHRFDIIGSIWLSCLLMGGAWLLIQSRQGDVPFLIPGGITLIVLTIFFVRYELNLGDPVLQPRLFQHHSFVATCAAVATSNLAMYITLISVPLILSQRPGWTDTHIGFVMLALSAAMAFFTPIGGQFADRFGRRRSAAMGLALLMVGMLILALTSAKLVLFTLLVGLGMTGMGIGLATPGLQTTAVEVVDRKEAGMAMGVYSTSRYLGSIIGASVLAAVMSNTDIGFTNFGAIAMMIVYAATIALVASFGLHDYPKSTD